MCLHDSAMPVGLLPLPDETWVGAINSAVNIAKILCT